MPNYMSVGGRLVFTAFFVLGFSGCNDGNRSSLSSQQHLLLLLIRLQRLIRVHHRQFVTPRGRATLPRSPGCVPLSNGEPRTGLSGDGPWPFSDLRRSRRFRDLGGGDLRYRAGQCSHEEAFTRVRAQINGGGVPGPCGQNEQPFPGRAEALSFRRQLEAVYQSRGAGLADTVVDDEGDVIRTMEYLSLRVIGLFPLGDHSEDPRSDSQPRRARGLLRSSGCS